MDAELGGCGMLVENWGQWIDKKLGMSEECLARGWTVTELPDAGLWFEGGLWLGCARLCGTGCSWEVGRVINLSNNIDSTVTNRFKQDPAFGPCQAVERYLPPPAGNGSDILWVDLVHDQPLADN